MDIRGAVSAAIAEATGTPFHLVAMTPVGGGDINQSFRLDGQDGSRFFLKVNEARLNSMFAAEAAGLAAIAATGSIRAPSVITLGITGASSFLVLEHLQLSALGNAAQLGEQLAAMHRSTSSAFGFHQENFIGSTPQPNTWHADWIAFWRDQRLGYQLALAKERGLESALQTEGERLLEVLHAFFQSYQPVPSLLHGDLWGGNHAFLKDGTPVLFDPAAYYGDRECDLAMTELFGGYPASFYHAYRAAWPLDEGYVVRRDLYNLYHILNHANLFGGSYARQALGMMQRLLATCR